MSIPRILFVAVLLVALVAGLTACGSNEVAARVNGEEISRAELDEQVELLRAQSPQMFEGEEGESRILDFRRRLLESMIDNLLVKQAAEERGVAVGDDEIDAQIDDLRAGFPSEEEFESALADANLTLSDLRDQIREQLTTQRLMEELAGDDGVTDAEVEEYYEDNKSQFAEQAATRSSHILFDLEDRATAEQVLDEVRDGGDFEELAREHSIDPGSASQGGDLGWSDPSRPFVPEFTEAMDDLDVGEVSDLIETDFGWHIIKIEERREERQKPLSDVADQIEQMILQQRNAEAYQEFLDELRAEASIEILIEELKPVDGE